MPYSMPDSFKPPLANFLPTLQGGNDITQALATFVKYGSNRSYLTYANAGAGYVFFHATSADLDTDGSGPSNGDPSHQNSVLLGAPINANEISYGVLPAALANHLGIRLGDVGVVVRNRIAITMILADSSAGPKVKPAVFTGELSLYAFNELGEPRFDGTTIDNRGMDGPLAFIWFPGVAAQWSDASGNALPSVQLQQAIHNAAVPVAMNLGIAFK